MKRILISESQVRGLLYEALSVDATFNKFYANSMSRDDFEKIIRADPTYGGGEQMGKYSQWLLTMVKKNKLNIDQLPKATELLNKYNLNKNKFKSKNIDDYKSVDDLYNEYESMEDELSSSSKRSQEQEAKRGAKKVYEDSEWLVIVPETQEASCYYGKGTQWCTAAVESQNYFDNYNDNGDLYININKKTKEKYQFHFEREEFRDAQNEDLTELSQDNGESIAEYCGFTEGLIKFYEDGPDYSGVLNEVDIKIDIECVSCEKSYYYTNKYGSNEIVSYDGEVDYNIEEIEIYENNASNYFIFNDKLLIDKNSDLIIYNLTDNTYIDDYEYNQWIKNDNEEFLEKYFNETFLDEYIESGQLGGVKSKNDLDDDDKEKLFYDFFRDLDVSCQEFKLERNHEYDGYSFLCDCYCECYDIEFRITLKLYFNEIY